MASPTLSQASGSFELTNVRIHNAHLSGWTGLIDRDGFAKCDVIARAGRIEEVTSTKSDNVATDQKGRIVFPTFVDCHTHIDKGHIWARSPNPNGGFLEALEAVDADTRARWSDTDLRQRMDFALRCAYAHGTSALRTHIDSQTPQDAISWPVFEQMREEWAGRIALQGVCLVGIEAVRDRTFFATLAQRVADAKGVLGAVTYMVPDLVELLDVVFATASAHGLDLDFHADETGDPDAASLRAIAEAALRHRFEGKILVGHCCSLAQQPDDEVYFTLDKVAEAGISVVSLPMCNLYLQDRRQDTTTPRWRGVTLVHEMRARCIPVAIASDNTRDPFYAYGDLDMLEVYREGTRILHLDHPVGDWPDAVASMPAQIMGLGDNAGLIRVGAPADLIIFKGRSWTELLSRPEAERIVMRDGHAIDTSLPDYEELDALMERDE